MSKKTSKVEDAYGVEVVENVDNTDLWDNTPMLAVALEPVSVSAKDKGVEELAKEPAKIQATTVVSHEDYNDGKFNIRAKSLSDGTHEVTFFDRQTKVFLCAVAGYSFIQCVKAAKTLAKATSSKTRVLIEEQLEIPF